jgi:endonuclease YncB( thermonuclease family)
VYGSEQRQLEEAQRQAQLARRGVWSQAADHEKPDQFKKRMKASV